jgi:putative tributyrin esterase
MPQRLLWSRLASAAVALVLSTSRAGATPSEPSLDAADPPAVAHEGVWPPSVCPPVHPSACQQRAAARGTLDSAAFWSPSLGVRKRYLVWLPPSYRSEPGRRYPSAYYLHGMLSNETEWTRYGKLDRKLDSLVAGGGPEMIVVMPDGDDGWYTTWNRLIDASICRRDFRPREGDTVDSYCVPWTKYDDYVARDLVAHIDSTYRTVADRRRRGIAGMSMGGYGAVSLALRYPDVFSAAASHSGAISPLYIGPHPFAGAPRYAATIEELRRSYGELFWPLTAPAFGNDTAAWWSRDPARLARELAKSRPSLFPALFVDVGAADGLADQSRAFRWELQRAGLRVDYAEWPGTHDWDYWRRHALDSLRWLARQLSIS